MVGGLINIVSYVTNDLYLTGAPEITFYKMVYRRYTNFAMESVSLDFDDNIKFDHELELVPPRIGDLLHKSYLHISLPSISIQKQNVGIDPASLTFEYANQFYVSNFDKIKNVYMKIMTDIYRLIYGAVNAKNVTYAGLLQDVQEYVNFGGDVLTILEEYDKMLTQEQQSLLNTTDVNRYILDYRNSDLWYILSHINPTILFNNAIKNIDTNIFDKNSDAYTKEIQRIMKNATMKEIDQGLKFCRAVQKYYFDKFVEFETEVNNDIDNNIKCAWVKNLGHSIVEYIDIYIGGKRIDRHLGIWINIWYQLTYKDSQIPIYNHLIGNVDALTNFDKQEKPSYDLIIPTSFWFNKFNGLCFPLIAMQYNDIRFSVKLRKLEEVFYIERIYKGLLNGHDIILTADMIDYILNRAENASQYELTNIEEVKDISLSDIWESKGKQLNGHIVMDYIYLESPERKRFAQSGHEYLIERLQYNDYSNITQSELDIMLDFTNPCKELVWVFVKDIYTTNEYGWNGCRWYDHSNNGANPILDMQIMINNYVRVHRQISAYFDTFQPLTHHRNSVSDGINMYSFCLDPMQQQPTGSCNFTKLINVKMLMNIDETFYRYTDEEIYPYDLDIDFTITISEPFELLQNLDIEFANKIYKYVIATEQPASLIRHMSQLKNNALLTIDIYNKINSINDDMFVDMKMSTYRKLIFKTSAKFYVFNLSLNILRLIGGYGSLAYSGNV